MRCICAFLLSALGGLLFGQAATPQANPPQPAPKSPEVHSDRSVTFRFRAPNAKEVLLFGIMPKPLPMQKNDQGFWTITTEPLDPDY